MIDMDVDNAPKSGTKKRQQNKSSRIHKKKQKSSIVFAVGQKARRR
jgi:hypothetical protein